MLKHASHQETLTVFASTENTETLGPISNKGTFAGDIRWKGMSNSLKTKRFHWIQSVAFQAAGHVRIQNSHDFDLPFKQFYSDAKKKEYF